VSYKSDEHPATLGYLTLACHSIFNGNVMRREKQTFVSEGQGALYPGPCGALFTALFTAMHKSGVHASKAGCAWLSGWSCVAACVYIAGVAIGVAVR